MKGQLEIFGIAIVMVLMMLALVVYLQLSSSPSNEVITFTSKTLPTQLISTILKTSTNCNDQNIETLIIDVSKSVSSGVIEESNLIQCMINGITENSFSVSNSTLSSILERSLEISNYDYEFLVTQEGFDMFSINSSNSCINARKVDADTFTIKGDSFIDISLRVC